VTQPSDLAVIGSGFGGSLLSMIAARLGLRVVLIERGRHPRFAIGESASPLAGILIEQLADRYDLPRIRPLSAFGTWQRACADVVCGVKRGFTYYRHELATPYRPAEDRRNQLLVAASPNDELSDTHWLRADVDYFLLREAVALGVDYIDEVELDEVRWGSDRQTLGGRRHGRRMHVDARLVVDASGPRGFLSRVLGMDTVGFADYPQTQALFSHFTGVARCDAMPDYASDERPPYPPDDAALHHVFDGGWMWVLRFGNGVTSAGVAVTDALAAELRLADGKRAWDRVLARYPTIAHQFAGSEGIREFTWMPQVAWRAPAAAGEGWAMLPSAAAFVDPLFSTGIPLTLLGVERIARTLECRQKGLPRTPYSGPRLAGYADATLAEADQTARFIGGCYAAFPRFDTFTAYSMFYFAAASFSEMTRRVGAPREDARFLCADHGAFAEATTRLSPLRSAPGVDYALEVARAIAPLNIAGLCDASKRNWYGIDFEDAIRGAGKLGVDPGVVARALSNASSPPSASPAE
jgi:tetracycline 7-halogenase / FADH2 O2-dependent halogenase